MKTYTLEELDSLVRDSVEKIYDDESKNIDNESDLKCLIYHHLYSSLKDTNYKLRTETMLDDMEQKKVDICIFDEEDYVIKAIEVKHNIGDSPVNRERVQNDENKLLEIIEDDPESKSQCYCIWFGVDVNYQLDNRIVLIKK